MKSYFYGKVLWTHISAFSDMFNELSVLVYDADGKAIGWKPVPISLGPKEKVLAAIIADAPGKSIYSPDNYLPRISITWTGVQRDIERQRGQHEKRKLFVEYVDPNESDRSELYEGCVPLEPQLRSDIQTVPYILNLEMTVWTKYMDDMAQILENILPFFNPDAPVSLCERGTGQERIVKATLDSINTNFVTELSNTDRRVLQANLSFSMEMNFYKPENPIESAIKRVTVRLGADTVRAANKQQPSVGLQAFAPGEEISTYTLPCSGGTCEWLDMDRKLWSSIVEFDDDKNKYMANQYHDKLRSSQSTTPHTPEPTNPNLVEDGDTYRDIPQEDFTLGTEGYYFTIPSVRYNKQMFEPDGTTVSFSWTVSTSSTTEQHGVEGTLYEGDPVDTSDVSGSYFVANGSDVCDELAEGRECG